MRLLSVLLLSSILSLTNAVVYFRDVQNGQIHAIDVDPSQIDYFQTYELTYMNNANLAGNIYGIGVDASNEEEEQSQATSQFDVNQFGQSSNAHM